MPSAIATLTTLLPMELVLTLRFDSQGCATTCSRAMQYCPISRKLGPWDYRELIETDSLFDVNIWATLAKPSLDAQKETCPLLAPPLALLF